MLKYFENLTIFEIVDFWENLPKKQQYPKMVKFSKILTDLSLTKYSYILVLQNCAQSIFRVNG